MYDQVNVYLVILILIFNDFSHSVLLKFQIAYGIEAGFFFFSIKNFSGFVENSHKNNEFW